VIFLSVNRFRHYFILLLFLTTAAAGEPWQTNSEQIVFVLTDGWDSTKGTLLRLVRTSDVWSRVADPIPVTVGKKGLGLGLGLHSAKLKGPQKREGDKRAPAGVFRLESAFGAAAMSLPAFPYLETTATDFWVDDPESGYYNQQINSADPGVRKDWKSAEILRRSDGIYDAVIVVAHNRSPIVPGRGSAIFMHAWYGPGVATIGCTAMEKSQLLSLLRWLNASKNPVLVQAPLELLPHLDLPESVSALINSR
jgi:L,D-peptidoglycan transpeptidase YkuD (ErfK/YbiS/YcfS/YnhG family)